MTQTRAVHGGGSCRLPGWRLQSGTLLPCPGTAPPHTSRASVSLQAAQPAGSRPGAEPNTALAQLFGRGHLATSHQPQEGPGWNHGVRLCSADHGEIRAARGMPSHADAVRPTRALAKPAGSPLSLRAWDPRIRAMTFLKVTRDLCWRNKSHSSLLLVVMTGIWFPLQQVSVHPGGTLIPSL